MVPCSKPKFFLLTLISAASCNLMLCLDFNCMPDSHVYCESARAGNSESQLTASVQRWSITTTVEVLKSGLGNTTMEELSLLLRDAFYDSLGRILPGVSCSPELVLDTHHNPAKSLNIECSLPALLVPTMAEALMLSRALTKALAVACHRLDCLQNGYTMLLNNHTKLVKNISAAEVRLCTMEDCCLPSQGSGRLGAQVTCLYFIWWLQLLCILHN